MGRSGEDAPRDFPIAETGFDPQATSDYYEHSCDDIRLAWLCAELGGGRTFRATPPNDFAALWADR